MSDTPTQAQMSIYIEAGYTVADIATDTGWSVSKVRYWLKKFDLQATRETKSIGHKSFKTILVKFFPNYPIEEEYHIGQRLRLDFYIPNLSTGFEVDGKQHEEIIDLFHSGSWKEFKKQQIRDMEKEDICRIKGILLIRIPAALAVHCTKKPEVANILMKDVIDRISKHEPPDKVEREEKPMSPTYKAYRERMKKLGRSARQENYRRAKELKDKLSKEKDAKKALSS